MSSSFNIPSFLIRPLRTPLLAIALPIGLGMLSGLQTADVVRNPASWYNRQYAPPFQPPREAFGIVWPALYAGMGYASHLAIKAHDTSLSPVARRLAYSGLGLYYAQLAMNLAWTPLFFGMRKLNPLVHKTQKFLALVDIVALTGTTVAMTVCDGDVAKPASEMADVHRNLAVLQRDLHEATNGATTWFLAPYVAWLSYATYLNAGYWWLNRNRPDTY
ncbi:hypothetical protein M407DRAFT_175985 [Tulasnella calospora MUT 4182]|uniref:TspO/MBR-related protein n=1 Tax=Tulasnella calospora MUT 4182 TaxID=1051891 RepID=A0A0C3L6G4_9AGAM|nr:hypothetical protein M407DRAFT_175985 [Tulasnella calospora MUT 4182]